MRKISSRPFGAAGTGAGGYVFGLMAALVLVPACGSSDRQTLEEAPVEDASGAGSAAKSGNQGTALPAASSGFVQDPPLLGGACTGQVAQQTFTAALCSCQDVHIAGYLRTRGLGAGDDPANLVGSVGVNADYSTSGYANVGGSFTVAGAHDVVFGGLLQAGQDLFLGPAADVAGVVRVGRDAWLADKLRAIGSVDIARDLYTAAGAGVSGIAVVDVGGTRHTSDVSVAPPCACGAGDVIDVGALVEDARAHNDNASIGLDPNALRPSIGIGTALELPSGRFYLSQIGSVGGINLRVDGKTALFVGGDLLATGAFRVELSPGAEIDLFVGGNLALTGAALFGDRARPSATRIYVAGGGDISVAGAAAFVGNLYAPAANVLVGGFGQIYGSLFGKNIDAAGFLSVGYDAALSHGGEACPPNASDVPRIR